MAVADDNESEAGSNGEG
ncbi:unnamed protein product, partial [Adineta steineri]